MLETKLYELFVLELIISLFPKKNGCDERKVKQLGGEDLLSYYAVENKLTHCEAHLHYFSPISSKEREKN